MPRIIIDGQQIDCRDGISVLQAALEAGFDVPHYCYHPALSVVGSCRLCLMEMKMPDPKTKEMTWAPRLIPSCQTPVREGIEVRFDSDAVRENRRHVMEYYLVNHPLDCPVCDKAGECYLQDYTLKFGSATSRMVEAKHKNPKKDLGPRTLLYQDRCVLCSRCVRFTQEISGTGELCIVNRGDRAEIDVFPGDPLDNRLQGNVVDICPVGCLLDKEFLHRQRVWFITGVDSICRACSTGCAIRIDRNDNQVWRIKPRYNPGVNDWWICDEGRFSWTAMTGAERIVHPTLRRGTETNAVKWEAIPVVLRQRLEEIVARHGAASIAVQFSPEMANEEAWLLATLVRRIAPEATLVLGPVRIDGAEERFPVGCAPGDEKFIIRPEKHPNRRGVETIIESLGGNTIAHGDMCRRLEKGGFQGLWIVGGYLTRDWPPPELVKAAAGVELLIVQDMLPGPLSDQAHVVLPFCAWVEREGSFMNHAGLVQPFAWAVAPPEGAMRDGQYLYATAGYPGLYSGERVREMMAKEIPAFGNVHVTRPRPKHQH